MACKQATSLAPAVPAASGGKDASAMGVELRERIRAVAREIAAAAGGGPFARLRPIEPAELVRRMRRHIVLN